MRLEVVGAACLTQGWPSWDGRRGGGGARRPVCRRSWVPQASRAVGLRLRASEAHTIDAAPEMLPEALETRVLSGGLRTAFRRVWRRLDGWEGSNQLY